MSIQNDVTVAGWLEATARRGPGRPAVTHDGCTWTFGDVLDRVLALAAGMRAGGVRPGDRVGFLGLNAPALLEVLFASASLGAVFVPLNFRLSGAELTVIINDAGVHTLFVDQAHAAVVNELLPKICCQRVVEADSADYRALMDHPPLPVRERVSADQPAVIMYTSGTTGRAKGVVLTHDNLWWNAVNGLLVLDILHEDRTLVVAPMFHIGGLNMTTLCTLQKGGHVVIHSRFDPGEVLSEIERSAITSMFAVPAMLLAMEQHPDFDRTDLSSLRMLVCGGAPVPEPLIHRYLDRGVQLLQGYGMTETAPIISLLSAEFALTKLGSAGKPPPFTEVSLVDERGERVIEPGQRGEICCRGPNVTAGYWAQPDATAAAFDSAGWLHTGDGGYLDVDGFLYVLDRVKDMVITGGENVYPAEVESVLYSHPAVAEVAVIGVPDGRWGERVTAVVVPVEGMTVTLEDIREFASPHLARYKLPLRLDVVPLLPRNAAGKVLKHQLREMAAGRSSA